MREARKQTVVNVRSTGACLITRQPPIPSLYRLVSALVLLFISHLAAAQGPLLYEVTRDDGILYLLGGTEVEASTDSAWLTPAIAAAIEKSDSLIVEIPPADPAKGIAPFRLDIYPSQDMHPVAIEEGYSNLAFGDYMDVTMGERSVVESQRLDLNGNWYRPMQPWVAYFYFGYQFWDRQPAALKNPEDILVELFRDNTKDVNSLFPDRASYFRFLGAMSDTAQTQFFQSMYNIMDWQRAGEYQERFRWTRGEPAQQFLDRYRQQTPLFYRYMYEQRNQAIAEQVLALLDNGGTYFLFVDINRTLGPDSLQAAFAELGADVTAR